ncbi:MAG: response regulator transcription factor [Chloroflexi bacterium]|nr:response regulator transcription factor [Chloroflexota bacterium]
MTDETKPIRVVLADDHELVLGGLQALLQNEPDMQVVAAVKNGVLLMEAVAQHQPDVVVLDLKMPALGGISCLEKIREQQLPIRVLVLTAYSDGESILEAIEQDADGLVLKTEPPSQTIAAIRQVAHGQMVFPRAARQLLDKRPRPRPDSELSEREREIFALVAEGMTNAQIAERLSVSESTVKFHLQNIFQKLRVTNRTEAAAVYHRQNQ